MGSSVASSSTTKKFTFYTWVITLGGFLFGYDTGIINGALPFLQSDFRLSALAEGTITGALTLGAALGAVTIGQLVDRFGRRRVLFVLALLFCLGSAGIAFAPSIAVLIAFRVVVGLAVGAVSAVVPLYLAELAPAEQRGAIVTRNQFMIVTGQLLSYAINAWLGNVYLEHAGIWRWMFALSILPALALFAGMFAVPESPRWLVLVGRHDAARSALARLEEQSGERRMDEIVSAVSSEAHQKVATLADFMKSPQLMTLLLIGAGIGITQQITGVNALMYYGTQVLRESGFDTDAALTANIANGAISVVGAAAGLWIVGKLSRRFALTLGLAGTTGCLVALALVSGSVSGPMRAWLVLLISVIFLVFQQALVSPITWVLMSEIFPSHARGAGMGTVTFASWLGNFAVSFTFPQVVAGIGLAPTFWIFAGLGVLAILFTRLCVPETAGQELD